MIAAPSTSSTSNRRTPRSRAPMAPTLPESRLTEIREAFDTFDTDRDGQLSYHELKVAMRALGFEMKRGEVLRILRENAEGGNKIAKSEFERVMTVKMLERDPMEEIKRAFKMFDDDSTGRISLQNLRRVARELGEAMDDEELQAMIDEFDLDQDGEINEQEFISIMQQMDM